MSIDGIKVVKCVLKGCVNLKSKILVVDDEQPIADILKFNLEKEGYKVICAYDGEEAIHLAQTENPDLILLDIMLPKKDGNEVCREIRKTHTMPIIMLTAKDSEIDKVLGDRKSVV